VQTSQQSKFNFKNIWLYIVVLVIYHLYFTFGNFLKDAVKYRSIITNNRFVIMDTINSKLNIAFTNDFTKINYHKKNTTIFNPAEQSIPHCENQWFVNTIVVLYRGKRNPINPSPKVFTLLIIPHRYNLSIYCSNKTYTSQIMRCIIVYSWKLFLTKSQKTYSSWLYVIIN
jgi:hypothetical protein